MIPAEHIPDADLLFYRVHVSLVKASGGKIRPNCFRDPGDGMSTDWSKYSTPERTRLGKGPEKAPSYGVVALHVERVRQIEALSVVHAPTDDNDAHAHVLGLGVDELLTQQRAELYDACDRRWTIAPEDPVALHS